MDEFEMNNEIDEKPMEYTNDIFLIEAIIEKNYNYFHYINIKECLYYMTKKYNNKIDYIILSYKIKEIKEIIKIFGIIFEIKDCDRIIYNNKFYELTPSFAHL